MRHFVGASIVAMSVFAVLAIRTAAGCGTSTQTRLTPDAAEPAPGEAGAPRHSVATDGALPPLLGPWVEVPPGTFMMGSKPDAWGRGRYDEDEVTVTLTHRFELGRYEVAQGEWTRFGLPNPSSRDPLAPQNGDEIGDRYPVGTVTWWEALAYANLRSERAKTPKLPCFSLVNCTGELGRGLVCTSVHVTAASIYDCEGYRLPTEAEWEYAARAGSTTDFYAGNFGAPNASLPAPDPALERIAWYLFNSNKRSHPIGLKEPNLWGVYDIAGNAYEWVYDNYSSPAYGGNGNVDPAGPATGSSRVMRGGCAWSDLPAYRSARRFSRPPDARVPLNGLRLARTLRPGEGVDTE